MQLLDLQQNQRSLFIVTRPPFGLLHRWEFFNATLLLPLSLDLGAAKFAHQMLLRGAIETTLNHAVRGPDLADTRHSLRMIDALSNLALCNIPLILRSGSHGHRRQRLYHGLIGAIWMKSSINLMREGREQPELKMIGREPEYPALKAFIRGLSLILLGFGLETYARLFLN